MSEIVQYENSNGLVRRPRKINVSREEMCEMYHVEMLSH